METVTVYVSDDETCLVRFDGEDVIQVDRIQTIWSRRRGSPSQVLSERTKRVIESSRAQRAVTKAMEEILL